MVGDGEAICSVSLNKDNARSTPSSLDQSEFRAVAEGRDMEGRRVAGGRRSQIADGRKDRGDAQEELCVTSSIFQMPKRPS